MCFQSMVGCLRSTTDSATLIKDPKLVFQFVKDKISSVNGDKYVHTAKSSPCELKHMVGVFIQSLRVSGRPQTAYHGLKAHWRSSFWGCFGMIVVDLDAVGHKFAANFSPETAEKTEILWKLRFSQTFYFWHSFWKTLYNIDRMSVGILILTYTNTVFIF